MQQSIEITKITEWDMGHRVPNHQGKCRNPHGHRYRLEVTIRGDICLNAGSSEEGMVLDFGVIKALLHSQVHDVLDHRFMVCKDDSILKLLPPDATKEFAFFIVNFVPTAENIVIWCYEQLKKAVPTHIIISALRLYETPNSWADYRPCQDPDD